MTDIRFCSQIQEMLDKSGYETSSSSTDEDGHSHVIHFCTATNIGKIYTENGEVRSVQAIEIEH